MFIVWVSGSKQFSFVWRFFLAQAYKANSLSSNNCATFSHPRLSAEVFAALCALRLLSAHPSLEAWAARDDL
jgi:hypothetical protein